MPAAFTGELLLGGVRTAEGITEHANCTVHEVIVSTAPLTDAEATHCQRKLADGV